MTQRKDNIKLDDTDTSDTRANGNTSNIRSRIWVFTLNNFIEDDKIRIENYAKKEKCKLVMQAEKGESGTPHLQGFIEFINARSFSSVKKALSKNDKDKRIHIEKARNAKAAEEYCKKEDTRIEEPIIIDNKKKRRVLYDKLDHVEPYPWQKDVIELVKTEPDDRTINWYWEAEGNCGKTALAKHLCIKYPNKVLYLSGKCTDVKYTIMKFLENDNNDVEILIFDFVRSTEQFISYEALETVKNGIFCNSKYECGMVQYNSPHVIVFANFTPDQSKLSQDRWRIVNIKEIEKKEEPEDDLDEL